MFLATLLVLPGADLIHAADQAPLELVQKIFPDSWQESLVLLVQQLREQIQQLRDQGEPAKDRLERTIASFSSFLEELAKVPTDLAQNLDHYLYGAKKSD